MTKAELVDEVSRVSDLTRKHSEVIVEAVFFSIVDALQSGDKIELRGFGSFRVRHAGQPHRAQPEDGRRRASFLPRGSRTSSPARSSGS